MDVVQRYIWDILDYEIVEAFVNGVGDIFSAVKFAVCLIYFSVVVFYLYLMEYAQQISNLNCVRYDEIEKATKSAVKWTRRDAKQSKTAFLGLIDHAPHFSSLNFLSWCWVIEKVIVPLNLFIWRVKYVYAVPIFLAAKVSFRRTWSLIKPIAQPSFSAHIVEFAVFFHCFLIMLPKSSHYFEMIWLNLVHTYFYITMTWWFLTTESGLSGARCWRGIKWVWCSFVVPVYRAVVDMCGFMLGNSVLDKFLKATRLEALLGLRSSRNTSRKESLEYHQMKMIICGQLYLNAVLYFHLNYLKDF